MTGWLTGWNYRKSHLITASAGAGTNYPVGIKVYYGIGTDGTEVVNGVTMGKIYLNGNGEDSDYFGDIRFTDDDGTTELDYWRDNDYLVAGTSAVFWVEVKDTLESNATIYVYYGKADTNTTSNGENTFLLFDHFDDASLDPTKWTTIIAGSGAVTEPAGTAALLDVNPAISVDTAGIKSVMTFTNGIAFLVKRKQSASNNYYQDMALGAGAACDIAGNTSTFLGQLKSGYAWRFYYSGYAGNEYIARQPASGALTVLSAITVITQGNGTYHIWEGRYYEDGSLAWIIDGSSKETASADTTFLSTAKNLSITQHSYSTGAYGQDTYIDYVIVRKCIVIEPAHSTWGDEEVPLTTYTKNYSIDILLQKLGITKPYSIDTQIQKLDIPKIYSIDVLFEKLGIEKPYDVDVLVKKLGITETYTVDMILEKLGIPKSYSLDVLFKRLGIDKTYSIDVFIRNIGFKVYQIDTLLQRLGVIRTYTIDAIFKKLGIQEDYGIDVLLQKLGIQEPYVIDAILKKLGIVKTYSIDAKFSAIKTKPYNIDIIIAPHFSLSSYGMDIRLISGEKVKGRLNIVKRRLMAMVKLADNTFTCIDEPTLKTWDISIPLATFKINPSHESKLSYGNKLPDGTRGQYFTYNFTIHVFASKSSTDQLEAKGAQEYAEVIVKYLRRNNKDTNSGILDIYDLTYRESDPEPHGTMRLSRVIITGKVLAERPWGTGFDN